MKNEMKYISYAFICRVVIEPSYISDSRRPTVIEEYNYDRSYTSW